MNKTYKALSTFKIKREDKSYLSLVKNSVVSLTSTEYNNVSAEGLFELTTGWQNAILTTVTDEAQTSSDASTVTLDFNVYSVEGVWLSTDTSHEGTNYFTGGSWSGKVLTLGTALPAATTAVIVNYRAMGNTITTTGGAIEYTKTFTGMTASNKQKILKVDFVVGGTMPADATMNLEVYNSAGILVESKSELLPTGTDTTVTGYFSGSFLNKATSYKVYGTVPQASGASYTVQVVITEVEVDNTYFARVTNNGMVSGVNVLEIDLLGEDGYNIDTKDIIKVAIASDAIGTLAAASLINGIAAGTDGELIETADDQAMQIMSESDGHIDLNVTPTNAGTATVTVLTIKGALTDGDLITFGTEVYEFTSGTVTDPSYTKVDITGLKADGIAALLETVFNNNTGYNVTSADTAGTATETVLTVGGVPVDGDYVTFGTEVYEFTTGAVSDPSYIKIDTTAMTLATEVTALFETVFNANTAYDVTAVDGGGTVTITANDLYTTVNSYPTTDTEAGVVLAWEDTTFGGGTGSSVTGVDPYVTFTATSTFETYNALATTDTEAGSLLSFPDTTFGGGTGASTPGVDPTSSYYLLIETYGGMKFTSQELPYTM